MTIDEIAKAYDNIGSSTTSESYRKGFAAGVESVIKKFHKSKLHYKSMEGYLEVLDILIKKSEFDYSLLGSNRLYLTLKSLRATLKSLG